MEDEESNYIVIGIGINIFTPSDGFPKEIKKIAGAIINSTKDKDSMDLSTVRGDLSAKIVNNIFYYRDRQDECLDIYRS